ncbi:MAG: peptide/nickel transport system permease protein [Frankiales bacterium]|nr:peptide/nickel transport system permease protein [Frankiales bacterium]
MIGYIARRLLALVPLLLIISGLVFSMTFLIPGDPSRTLAGGLHATPERVADVRHQLGLDQSVVHQYWHWLTNALSGDLGTSLFSQTSVATEIGHRFPITLSLAVGALVVALLLGVPAGIAAGTRPGSLLDRLTTLGTSTAIAVPDFWLGIVLVIVFAVKLHSLPAIGYVGLTQSPVEWATHLYLPWLALGIGGAAPIARQLRGALIDVLARDYIRTASAKGLPAYRIVLKHALKNAAIAPVTVIGIQFAYLLGGTVIIEYIFSIPGMGLYFFNALSGKDLPVIQGVTLVVALTFVMLNLAVDVLYAYLNPKVRLG